MSIERVERQVAAVDSAFCAKRFFAQIPLTRLKKNKFPYMWRDAYREIIESMFLQADSFEVLLLGIKSAEVESLSFFLSRDCF